MMVVPWITFFNTQSISLLLHYMNLSGRLLLSSTTETANTPSVKTARSCRQQTTRTWWRLYDIIIGGVLLRSDDTNLLDWVLYCMYAVYPLHSTWSITCKICCRRHRTILFRMCVPVLFKIILCTVRVGWYCTAIQRDNGKYYSLELLQLITTASAFQVVLSPCRSQGGYLGNDHHDGSDTLNERCILVVIVPVHDVGVK